MTSHAKAMLKQSPSMRVLKQSELDADVEGETRSSVPATEARYVGPKWTGPPAELKSHERAIRHETLARAIAARQLKHLHELAHIDYDLCLDDPDVRAVVAEALRWAALGELENA